MTWLIESKSGHRCELPPTLTEQHDADVKAVDRARESAYARYHEACEVWERASKAERKTMTPPVNPEQVGTYRSSWINHSHRATCFANNPGSVWMCDTCGLVYELTDGNLWQRLTFIPRGAPQVRGRGMSTGHSDGTVVAAALLGAVLS